VQSQARERRLLSAEHFPVEGTLLEALAGQKSFKRKNPPRQPPDDPRNPSVTFREELATLGRAAIQYQDFRGWTDLC
jgi:hypothetical protein